MLVFLFTDIEGSTRFQEEQTEVMTGVIARPDEILRELINSHGGRITKHTGEEFATLNLRSLRFARRPCSGV